MSLQQESHPHGQEIFASLHDQVVKYPNVHRVEGPCAEHRAVCNSSPVRKKILTERSTQHVLQVHGSPGSHRLHQQVGESDHFVMITCASALLKSECPHTKSSAGCRDHGPPSCTTKRKPAPTCTSTQENTSDTVDGKENNHNRQSEACREK